MSFRERSAWVMGAIMLIAGLNYLFRALTTARDLGWQAPPVELFVPLTMTVVVAVIVAQIALAAWMPKEAEAPADERERPLLDRAGNWAGFVFGFGAITGLIKFLVYQDGLLLFHFVLGSLILAQIAEYAFQIVLFRRNS